MAVKYQQRFDKGYKPNIDLRNTIRAFERQQGSRYDIKSPDTIHDEFDWSSWLQSLAGTYLGAKMPYWISEIIGNKQPTMQQNTKQMKKVYGKAFDEQEQRIQSRLNQRGLGDAPQISADAYAPLATERAMTMAQLDTMDNQAQYLDAQQRYMQNMQLIQAMAPLLFQYSYENQEGEDVTKPGALTWVINRMFNLE